MRLISSHMIRAAPVPRAQLVLQKLNEIEQFKDASLFFEIETGGRRCMEILRQGGFWTFSGDRPALIKFPRIKIHQKISPHKNTLENFPA